MNNGQEDKNRKMQVGKFLLSYFTRICYIVYEVVNVRCEFIFEFACFLATEKLNGLTVVAVNILFTSLQTMRSSVESNQGE